MMRSLFAGVSGLRAHQIRMDVIGNNIANVNTTAFKSSRVNFADMYNQTIAGAMSPNASRGGINGKQVGLGVGVASIDTDMTEGSMQLTGKATDMAISGNGFFILKEGSKFFYTRAGNFDFDSQGFLVNKATGQRVQGWLPNGTGQFPTRELSTLQDIRLPVADSVLAKGTSNIAFDQSLNANAPAGTVHKASITVIDSLGAQHTLMLNFTKAPSSGAGGPTAPATSRWDLTVTDANGAALAGAALSDVYGSTPAAPRLEFDNNGKLVLPTGVTSFQTVLSGYNAGNGSAPMTINLDFTKVIQPSLPNADMTSTLRMLSYDGYPTGALTNISVDANGVVTGYYDNNQYRQVAQIGMANFFNPAGLMKDRGNNWVESPNSGMALVGSAGEGGRGVIASNNLEMSNVDISQEFTNMIVTQRGFQANSRVITTTDEMLQDVVNLKR